MRIDLNSDVGESYGEWTVGEDETLIPLVTSVNVACGFHAGDPVVMERSVELAHRAGVAIGAHPGYPDLAGFGRRALDMRPDELEAAVLYQVGALAGICRAAGTALRHVKPHGALYNRAARDPSVAERIVRGVARFANELALIGPPGSQLLAAARATGLRAVAEGFADRAYEADGSLRSRQLPGALLAPAAAASQAVSIVRDGRVLAVDGTLVPLEVDTLCVHGDSPNAAAIARAVRDALEAAGAEIRPFAIDA